MTRRELLVSLAAAPVVAKACIPLPIGAVRAGALREHALEAFRQNVNRPPLTMFSTEHWLTPKLSELRGLLPEVLSADHAQALLDVLHGKAWMCEILPWLQNSSGRFPRVWNREKVGRVTRELAHERYEAWRDQIAGALHTALENAIRQPTSAASPQPPDA